MTYAWDYENRLTSVTLPSTAVVSFKYDPPGRRIRKTTASATTIYAYDGRNVVEETDAAGTAQARFAMGLSIDEPLAQLRSGTTHFYNADGLGSITSLTNWAGAVAASYTYDTFGSLAASSGSVVNPFRYTAREWDAETGLYFYRARYFDQTSGRFLSEDPLQFGAGSNFYPYVFNNPTALGDPSGLQAQTAAAASTASSTSTAANTASKLLLIQGGRAAISGTIIETGSVGGAIGVLVATDIVLAIQVAYDAHDLAIALNWANSGPYSSEALNYHSNQAKRKCENNNCKPCVPPVGTIAYRLDTTGRAPRRG